MKHLLTADLGRVPLLDQKGGLASVLTMVMVVMAERRPAASLQRRKACREEGLCVESVCWAHNVSYAQVQRCQVRLWVLP